MAPEVATSWDAEQKSSARHVISEALDDKGAVATAPTFEIGAYKTDDELVHALATLDARRLDAGDDALALVHVRGSMLMPQRAQLLANAAIVDALASASGYTGESALTVTNEPRLTVAAAYLEGTPPRLLVNPIVLTAFDDGGVAIQNTARQVTGRSQDDRSRPRTSKPAAAGNPYSFYGSVAECAQAQRLRCEACLPSNNCTDAVTTANANDECTMLAANNGRGYYLECINLSLAITSVEKCTADAVGSCARVTTAAADINQLDANADFLDDMSCGTGLDGCLAKIYGAPSGTFPSLIDGGMPTADPPRNPDVSCSDSCSSNNDSNCDASPNCSCDGPSCNNSLSCDSTCASSNDQSGCGGGCDSCNSSSDGGGSTGGGGCGGSSSGGSSGGGCGGSSSGGSSSSSGCGSCGSSSSSSSSDSGCGSCGSSSSSSTSNSSGCGGGGGGGGCQVTEREPSAIFAVAFSLGWAFLPIPFAAVIRRRSRKQKRSAKEVQS